jgi:hypothetical protein
VTPERWRQIKPLLASAIDCPPAERAALVAEAADAIRHGPAIYTNKRGYAAGGGNLAESHAGIRDAQARLTTAASRRP